MSLPKLLVPGTPAALENGEKIACDYASDGEQIDHAAERALVRMISLGQGGSNFRYGVST